MGVKNVPRRSRRYSWSAVVLLLQQSSQTEHCALFGPHSETWPKLLETAEPYSFEHRCTEPLQAPHRLEGRLIGGREATTTRQTHAESRVLRRIVHQT